MNKLSPGQVTEMKKVFALFNRSGTKQLTVEELSIALEKISGSKPNLDEVQGLMSALDKDNDGRVSWNEFYSTLSIFISSRESLSNRFNSTDIFDKKRLHTNIADFFLQFKKSDNWSQLQHRRLQIHSSINTSLTEEEIKDNDFKKESLDRCRKMCQKMPDVVSSLHHSVGANDIKKTTDCVQYLADILSILNLYNSDQDRLSIAEFLATLFRRIRDANVSKKIISFLKEFAAPQLQYQACRFVTHYCQGPRIPNTPKQSSLHPERMYHKGLCLDNGAIPALEALFSSNQEKLRNKAIEAVGKIASHDLKARVYVINEGITVKLINLIHPSTSITTIRYVTWTLAIILGNTHTTRPANLNNKLLQAMLEKLGKLLFDIVATFRKDFEAQKNMNNNINNNNNNNNNQNNPNFYNNNSNNNNNNNNNNNRLSSDQKKELEKVLMNILCCLSYLIPGIKNFPIFWEKFIELITFPLPNIQCMVLDCIKDIVSTDINHLKQLINIGLLNALKKPFSATNDIASRHKSLALISAIVKSNRNYIQNLVQCGYIKPLLKLMATDDLCRLTVVKIIRYITYDRNVTIQLVQQNSIIHELGEALNLFKKFDPVIREVYHYVGPTYNFEFIEDIIETLNNILECGKMNNGNISSNIYIIKFDMQLLDRISDVIMKMAQLKGIESWRNTSTTINNNNNNNNNNNQNESIENRMVTLLESIKFTHLRCNTQLSNEVRNFVDDLILKFRKTLSQNQYKSWNLPTGWQTSWNNNNYTWNNQSWSEFSKNDINKVMQIKCIIGNTGKFQIIHNVNKNILLADLQYRLSQLCHCPVRIYYADRFQNNKQIFIRGQSDLNNAIVSCTFNQLELLLQPVVSNNNNNNNNNNNFNSMSPNAVNNNNNNMFSDNNVINNFAKQYGLPTNMINTLWTSFRSSAKDGTINKQSFINIMKKVNVNDLSQIDQLFSAFDYDKNNLLDFREICAGFAILHRGTAEDKIKLAFKSFDIDDNGKITETELFMMFKSIVTTKGIKHNKQDIDVWVKDCFTKYDLDNKGHLTYDEFKTMVHRRPLLIQAFFQFQQ